MGHVLNSLYAPASTIGTLAKFTFSLTVKSQSPNPQPSLVITMHHTIFQNKSTGNQITAQVKTFIQIKVFCVTAAKGRMQRSSNAYNAFIVATQNKSISNRL
jgi:hypothetical protein